MSEKQVETKVDVETSADETKTSEADQKQINIINAAVKNHLKRFSGKELPEMLAKFFDERGLGKAKELTVEETDESDEDEVQVKPAKQNKSKTSSNAMGEVEKLRAELKAEKQASRQREAMVDVKSHLSGKVRPEALDMALTVISAKNMIQLAKDGSVSFQYDGETYEDISEGVSAWMKSKEAAVLLLPPSVGSKDVKKAGFKPLLHNDKGSDKNQKLTATDKLARLGIKL